MELSSNQPTGVTEAPATDPSLDLGDQLLRDAQIEWVAWPDENGLYWAKPPAGPVTVCRAVVCCSVHEVQFIGDARFYFAYAALPGGVLEGFRFARLDVPSHIR